MSVVSNLGIDMNPLANPLTSGRISNTFGLANGFSKPANLNALSVPDPVITYSDAVAAVH